jgi:hypothetical protein
MAIRTPNGGSIVAEPPFCNSALRFEHDGASGPGIQFNWVPDAEAALMSSNWLPGCGDEETRTPDPLLAKEMLCQLSYVPRRQGSGGRHWTRTSDLCLIRAAL